MNHSTMSQLKKLPSYRHIEGAKIFYRACARG
uniref:Uncharacterized protein n=1 Tax=Arundo donax TaxID=35708 RepID=A0A0A9GML7_ARUDO